MPFFFFGGEVRGDIRDYAVSFYCLYFAYLCFITELLFGLLGSRFPKKYMTLLCSRRLRVEE